MEMINFFDLKEDDLKVLNPYDFQESLNRLNNLTLEDVKNDLKYFQKKDFDFRTYEEEVSYSLKSIKFLTSFKDENGESIYYLLKDLDELLIPENLDANKNKDIRDNKEFKRIQLDIKNGERGKRTILIIINVDPEKLSSNILNNFIKVSKFETAMTVLEQYKNIKEKIEKNEWNNKDNKENKYYFRFTIKVDMKQLNKIYYSKEEGKYLFDLQSPPLFRTNFFNSKKEEDKEKDKDKDKDKPMDENCVFPFRNFENEIDNLEYRHFIIMLEKDTYTL